MLRWQKRGVIFRTTRNQPWMVSHACVPTALALPDGRIRLYFSPRNEEGKSIPTYIEVSGENPANLLYVHDRPILELGELGTFDDSGVMPCSILECEGQLYLYYVGWNEGVSVPYRNAIGLALSSDGGRTFQRAYQGPIVDRSIHEPFFTASPCVLKESANWHMWYASSTGFVRIDGKPEPLYVIKYASSSDGVNWNRPNQTCIFPLDPLEANARPTVIRVGGDYHMWFCFRGSRDYRDGIGSYRIGYAISEDAVQWKRDDKRAGIGFSSEGWDSTMLAYPNVLRHADKYYLFYNGNGFGRSGIGYAEAEEPC